MNKISTPAPTNTNPLRISPATKLGPLHLRVTSIENALPIWRDMVGLHVIAQTGSSATLGIDDRVLIELTASATHPVKPKSLGLYHVAIHVPTRKELARAVARQLQAGVRTLPTDHLVSEATYLWDADGNGIEMTFETPWRGSIDHASDPIRMVHTNGTAHSGVEPLDLDDLMSELTTEDDLAAPLPSGTRLGHVHVHVNSLESAMDFYADTLGFQRQLFSYNFGMGDVKTNYEPHILAFNIWSGADAQQSDKSHAGLEKFEIIVPTSSDLQALTQRLRDKKVEVAEAGEKLIAFNDPAGNLIEVRSA